MEQYLTPRSTASRPSALRPSCSKEPRTTRHASTSSGVSTMSSKLGSTPDSALRTRAAGGSPARKSGMTTTKSYSLCDVGA